jgi:hypothetical protein
MKTKQIDHWVATAIVFVLLSGGAATSTSASSIGWCSANEGLTAALVRLLRCTDQWTDALRV